MPDFYDRLHLSSQGGGYHLIGSDSHDFGKVEFKTLKDFTGIELKEKEIWKKVHVSIGDRIEEGYINIKSNSLLEKVTYSESTLNNSKAINTFVLSLIQPEEKSLGYLAEVLADLGITLKEYKENPLEVAKKLLGLEPDPRKIKGLFVVNVKDFEPEKKLIVLEVFEQLAISMIEKGLLHLTEIPTILKTTAVCLAAVKHDSWSIEHVPSEQITEEICLEAMSKNGYVSRHIPKKHQTKELFMAAVQKDGRVFPLVPPEFQTRDLCLVAIEQCGLAIKDLPRRLRNPEIYLLAIQQNGLALDYVPIDFRTVDMCLLAVKNNGLALKYVPEKTITPDICLLAIEQEESAFYFVPRAMMSFDFCCAAVNRNGVVLEQVLQAASPFSKTQFSSEQKAKMCYLAVKQNPNALEAVPEEHRTEELFFQLLNEKRLQYGDGSKYSKLGEDLAHKIARYRNPQIQEALAIIALSSDQSFYRNMSEIASNAACVLPSVVLSALVDPSIDISSIKSKLKSLSKTLKDRKKPLLQSLLSLEVNLYFLIGLDHQQKISIIENCLNTDDLNEIILRAQLLSTLTETDFDFRELKDFASDALVRLLLTSLVQSEFIDPAIENLEEKFQKTFLSSRIPSAIFTYSLSLENDQEMKEIIKEFISDVLEGTFIENRNKHNSHASYLTLDQKNLWQQSITEDISDLLDTSADELDFKKFLYEKLVIDKHANLKLMQLVQRLQKEESSAHFTPLARGAISIEEVITNLYLSSKKEDQLMLMQKLAELLIDEEYAGLEFQNDVKVKLKQLLAPQSAEKAAFITDSDDWQDLFLCGTEVSGSCQRVDGSPDFTKCLMGYVMDGKVRIIKVADQEGKIISRAILKLVLDNKDKPALLLERVYPEDSPTYAKLISIFAFHKAESLDLSVYEYAPESKITLHSDGNYAPYEYEDAGEGVTKGDYKIPVTEITA